MACAGDSRPTKGASIALTTLRERGFATGVVSNFDRRLPGILADVGLAPLLDCVVLPSDVGAAKPSPAIFERALALLGATGAQTIFVGDDPETDLAGAARLGLRTVDVASLATLTDLPARLIDRSKVSEISQEPNT